MKKLFKSIAVLFSIISIFAAAGCKNNLGNSGVATIVADVEGVSRTIVPDFNTASMTDFVLYKTSVSAANKLGNWNNYNSFSKASLEVEPGTYDLILTSKLAGVEFKGEAKNVKAETGKTTRVSFTLSVLSVGTETAKGTLNLTINLPNDDDEDLDAGSLKVKITSLADSSDVSDAAEVTSVVEDDKIVVSVTAELDPGEYIVTVKATKGDSWKFVNYSEVAVIISGLTSTKTYNAQGYITGSALPVIKIKTTDPDDPENPLAFVTEPISDTVKIHSTTGGNSWGTHYLSKPSPWYEECEVTVQDEFGGKAIKNAKASVKSRGNYTTTYDKKGLRIKFDKKQNMLGLHEGEKFKNWVLVASWKDYSMIRDYTAYNLAHLMTSDYYATDYKHVDVYINDEYWGVYLLVEQQEEKRVEITEYDDKAAENNLIGYLLEYDTYAGVIEDQYLDGELVEQDFFKMDSYGDFLDVNGEKVTGYLNQYYTIKSDYDETNKVYIKNYMDNLWYVCREAIENNKFYEIKDDNTGVVESTETSAEACISKVLDIDSLVNTVIQQEIVCDLDLHWSSFYMDLDLNPAHPKRLTFEAPWDFDSSFGNHTTRQIGTGEGQISHLFSVTTESPCDGNAWTVLFGKVPWFQDKVRAKWAEMNAQGVKEQLIADINKISDDPIYVDAFARNYERWDNIGKEMGDEITAAGVACTTQREAADLVISYINQRWAMLDRDFVTFESSNKGTTTTDRKVHSYTIGETEYEDIIEVEAKEDGLHIKKIQDSVWEHVSIHFKDESIDQNLFWIGDTQISEHVYPYVQAGHVYSVWLESQDSSWQNWHSTEAHKAKVKAIGGIGDAYFKRGEYVFDRTAKTISYSYFEAVNPTGIDIAPQSSKALAFEGTPWESGYVEKECEKTYGTNSVVFTIDDSGLKDDQPYNFWEHESGGVIIEYWMEQNETNYGYQILYTTLW